ncbi:hypothetical protein J437_LFUL018474 [Ladona fulva]|uniref:BTB domain-containing protein n=1 Tax=Ladona fulva TaxID=123851 RepID=A0A8K0PA12_LADFU|nr:hypothetical protein J437_LFUL018474 [Ladona fulva]
MATEQFCLKWNNFQSNIITNLENLKCNGDLVDVTLTCEGKSVKAHKVILSACSSYFRTIFKENPCPHPIVILKGVTHRDISSLISFMYQGEVHIQEDQLSSFLRTAEHLQIKGLADVVMPDEMLMSEPLEWKEHKSRNASPVCPSSAPEAPSSPRNSPFLSPQASPTSALASRPLQSMHVSDFPLSQSLSGIQGSKSAECLGADRGNRDGEAWRVNPKMEPMESETVGMQERNEEANSQRIYSIDWRSLPPYSSDVSSAPRLEIVQRRCPIERAQIPLLSGQSGKHW